MAREHIEHVWSVLCEDAIIDSNSNNISLLKCLEQVTINFTDNVEAKNVLYNLKKENKDLIIPIKLTLASLWFHQISHNEQIELRLNFFGPSNTLIWSKDHTLLLEQDKSRTRSIMKFEGLHIPKESGVSTFILKLKQNKGYKEIATIPLEINIIE